jgi:hypothetical protein
VNDNIDTTPAMMAFIAIGLGAAMGAWLRWGLGIWLNPVHPSMPLGTLAANLLGGYVIGLAIAWFSEHPGLPPEARLFLITGLLGFGRHGRHDAGFFELAGDLPVVVEFFVEAAVADQVLNAISAAGLKLVYAKLPAEIGLTE